MERTGDVHATQFLIQQVSIDVQHGNVATGPYPGGVRGGSDEPPILMVEFLF